MGSSCIRDQTCVSCVSRQILYHWATREAQDSTSLTSFQVLPMWTTKYSFEYKILASVKLKFCDSISRESLPEAHGPTGMYRHLLCSWCSPSLTPLRLLLLFSHQVVSDSANPWTAECQASMSLTMNPMNHCASHTQIHPPSWIAHLWQMCTLSARACIQFVKS